MMQVKLIEIRDRMTFIPAIATRMWSDGASTCSRCDATISDHLHDRESYLIRSAGYGPFDGRPACVLLTRLGGGGLAHCDPYDWCDRTWTAAHHWIEDHWNAIDSGDVVDVEYILGETAAPKLPQREEWPTP